MWRIIKAELHYNKYLLLYPFCISLPLVLIRFTWAIIENRMTSNFILNIGILITFIIILLMTYRVVKKSDEKRIRFHVLLPISIYQICISQYLNGFIIWMGLVLYYFINHILPSTNTIIVRTMWGVLSMNGMCMIIYALHIINRDFQFLFTREHILFKQYSDAFPSAIVALSAMSVGITFVIFTQGNLGSLFASKTFFVRFIFTPWGALAFNTVYLILFYASVKNFVRRRSFLE